MLDLRPFARPLRFTLDVDVHPSLPPERAAQALSSALTIALQDAAYSVERAAPEPPLETIREMTMIWPRGDFVVAVDEAAPPSSVSDDLGLGRLEAELMVAMMAEEDARLVGPPEPPTPSPEVTSTSPGPPAR